MSKSTLSCFLILLSISLVPAPARSIQCDKTDKITLLKFKDTFKNPSTLSSWNPSTDCCTWEGVFCEMFTGQLLGLTISKTNLTGQIPTIIGDFPVLSYIKFEQLPYLTGSIPESITNLSYLKELVITNTAISGSIPPFIQKLEQAFLLNLSSNHLTGPIPGIFGHNFFELDFSRNKLTGTIPASLFEGSITNPRINLSHNQLSGNVPAELGKVDFGTVDLSYNNLSGGALVLFGLRKSLSSIDLSNNKFGFDMGLVRFSEYLVTVNLSHNVLRGGISRQITRTTALMKLDLSYNRLCGRIPAGGKMRRFGKESYGHNKCLCGTPLPRNYTVVT